ncbi:restriction endonuclease subunit S [Streptomyces sp. NBC_00257]|uniref:restriction endonuclease subunit S n=1 Tax=unclassified Streptomyces TaxID=2593676 RepID=UPI00225140A9|nr:MULTISPECIES: restriction endonuclease subunit S [unclassified Streptomyces]MCX5431569.1 restriction endonuclease subunit S [Streptomyces sp. NBC_00062]
MHKSWQRVTLGEILKLRSERTHSVTTLLSVTADRGVIRQSESGRRDSSSADKSLYWDVRSGDAVYNTMRMWQGVSGVAGDAGIVSPAYTVCEPTSDAHSGFLGHLLREPKLVTKFLNLSQGLVSDTWNLKYSEFKKIEVDLPPMTEQRRIAHILDDLDIQIQNFLTEADKLDATCHAVLSAKLHEAFHPLRETEVSCMAERLGEEIDKFRFVTVGELLESIEAGHSPDLENRPASEGQWGVLKVSAVGRNGFRQQENKRVDDPTLIDPSIEVEFGDLLMTRANTPELVGMTCVVGETQPGLMLSDKTLRLNLHPREGDPHFLGAVLRQPELRRQIEVAATGTSSSMKNIGQKSIRKLVIPWTAPSNQAEILAPVAEIRHKKDRLISEVVKLRLTKSSVMGDLLAGKVRVPIAS